MNSISTPRQVHRGTKTPFTKKFVLAERTNILTPANNYKTPFKQTQERGHDTVRTGIKSKKTTIKTSKLLVFKDQEKDIPEVEYCPPSTFDTKWKPPKDAELNVKDLPELVLDYPKGTVKELKERDEIRNGNLEFEFQELGVLEKPINLDLDFQFDCTLDVDLLIK